MQLIFHDRRPLVTAPTGEAFLTIERKGTFSLSIAAVARLGLRPTDEVVLAEDAETNNWYLVPSPAGDLQGFELRPRDKTSNALMFCGQHRARAYYQAHGLGDERSVRSLVSATAVEHGGVQLYPLTPQHATKVPAAAEAVASPTPVAEHRAQPDVAPLASDLPFLQEQPTAPPMLASAPAPVSSVSAPILDETLEQRMERLTDYWYSNDIRNCDDAELAELQSLLADKPKRERDIVENAVLNMCKTERVRRNKKALAIV